MGQRANLIIVQYGNYELFYSHWAANTLTSDLFWSPEFATAFIQTQQEVDKESGWLDEVWAEGGAVVDWDNKVFLLFGGEDVLWNVPLRRLYLKLIGCIWQGWTIKWAYEGIADIADYVNYPRSKVLAKQIVEPKIDSKPKRDNKCDLSPPEEKSWAYAIISVVFSDNSIGLFPLSSDMENLLYSGSQLAREVVNQRNLALKEIILGEWVEDFPWGGIHLDLASHDLEFWLADDSIDIVKRIEQYWSDWNIVFHQDNFEFQELKTNNKLQFSKPSYQTLRKEIEETLMIEAHNSPVDGLLKFSELARQEGKEVEINPLALRNSRTELDIARRKEILDLAFEKVLNN